MRQAFFFLGLLLFSTAPAMAGKLDEFYIGVRAAGMGNAFTCVSDDLDGVFYNPAGLAQNGVSDLTLLSPKFDFSTDDGELITPIRAMASGGFDSKALQTFFGKDIYFSGSNFTALRFPGFALGYYYGANLHLIARNAAFPQIQLDYYRDNGMVGGYGFETRGFSKRHFMRLGLGVKWLSRIGYSGMIPLAMLASASKATLKTLQGGPAMGWGVSPGIQYEFPVSRTDDVILGAVWQDMGDTSFGNSLQANRPPAIRNNLAAGLLYRHRFNTSPTRKQNFKITAEMRHLAEKDLDPRLKLHVGFELETAVWLVPLSLRVGFSQDNPTFGIGTRVWVLDVEAAYYGVENQSLAFLDREQRVTLQATLRFETLGARVDTQRDADRKKHPRQY